MAVIKIAGFAGEARAPHPKLLPDTVGTLSRNQKPGRGDLRPWKEPLAVATVPAGRQTIYRFGRDVVSDASYWFGWTGVVHAVRSMIADDTTERTYYSGDGAPKWTDNTLGPGAAGTAMPQASRQLGVPVPVGRPTTSATGGASTTSTYRYYVYTFVTDKGEESAPSPVSADLYCATDATVTVGNIDAAPSGAFTINRVRIYVTQSGTTGDTEFYFLREITAGQASTTDDNRSRGEMLPTEGWLPPPSDLRWLTGMWNGMMAGISGNAVRYAVAYKPYAWPVAYETLPPNAKPVAIATFGQRLLVLTTAKPLLVQGTSPDSLDEQPLEIGQSCVAPRGVVSFGHGVAWPCPDGLAYVGDGGTKMLTAGLLTRDDWQAMRPDTLVAGIYEGAYLGFYTDSQGVRRGFLIDPLSPSGLFFLDTGYAGLYFDELQDALYVLDGTSVRKWDAGSALLTARFVSKVFAAPAPVSFGFAKVVADAYPVTARFNMLGLAAAEAARYAAKFPGRVAAYGTGVQFTQTVASPSPFRLPAIPAKDWQVELAGTTPIQGAVLATSIQELSQ